MAINPRTLFIVTLSFTLTSLIFSIAVTADYQPYNYSSTCGSSQYYTCWSTILSLFVPFGPLTHAYWFFILYALSLLTLSSLVIYTNYNPNSPARPMFPYVIYGLYTLMNILSLVSDPARSFSERALKIGSVWVIYVILSLVVSATPFWLCLWYINVKSKEVKVWQPAQKTGLVIASDLGKGGSSGGGENVVEIYSPLIDQSQDQNGESSGVQYIYGNAGSSPTQAKQLPPVPVTFTA